MQYYDLRFQLKHAVTDSEAMDYGVHGYFFDSTDGVPYVSIDVVGETAAGMALFEAHRMLREDGLEIVRAVPNLVTVSSMASRFSVSRQAAQRWTNDTAFPLPVITDGMSLWHWPEVRSWVQLERRKETYDDSLYPPFDAYTLFNASVVGPAGWAGGTFVTHGNRLASDLLKRHSKPLTPAMANWGKKLTIGHFDAQSSDILNFTWLEPNFEADLGEGGRFRERDQRV